ncbi:helix-turn-helix domain-containing protein [Catellatospora aurea]|uniref:Helix-turn-helix domain-containing protein n=1 Tax=Catellatospora aurea TaxID=1337874 RepID=A0ABW2GR47_9ACTN
MPDRRRRRAVISGYVVKLIRESLLLSQDALAERLAVDRGTVQGWESGRRSLTALSVEQSTGLRHRLAVLGAKAELLGLLDDAALADYLLASLLLPDLRRENLPQHPVGWVVMTRSVMEMIEWPVTGRVPDPLRSAERAGPRRRGPVAESPSLDRPEIDILARNLRSMQEWSSGSGLSDVLLRRQARFLGALHDRSGATEPDTRRSVVPGGSGWSLLWAEARSAAASKARHGDPEPLRHFIAATQGDDRCELAGLNYEAYWIGEVSPRQNDDRFMMDAGLGWRGHRLLRHLVERVDGRRHFVDLSIHTLWALLAARPGLLRDDPVAARSLYRRGQIAIDSDEISRQSRWELEAIMYGLRIEGLAN